jgi:hypothetical protein
MKARRIGWKVNDRVFEVLFLKRNKSNAPLGNAATGFEL